MHMLQYAYMQSHDPMVTTRLSIMVLNHQVINPPLLRQQIEPKTICKMLRLVIFNCEVTIL
jgi:hypothetical protein